MFTVCLSNVAGVVVVASQEDAINRIELMCASIKMKCFASLSFFFFQAEDGIRDHCVTGVQTCALPISTLRYETGLERAAGAPQGDGSNHPDGAPASGRRGVLAATSLGRPLLLLAALPRLDRKSVV